MALLVDPYLNIILVLIIVFLIVWKTHFSRIAIHLNKLPGLPVLPIFGNVYYYLFYLDIPKGITYLFKKYDGYYHFWLFYKPYLIVANHKIAEKILSSPKQIERNVWQAIPYIGEGLISSEGKQWKSDRRELNHSFSPKFIKEFLDVFNTNSEMLMVDLKDKFEDKNSSQYINLMPVLMKWALSVVLESSMGTLKLSAEDLNKDFAVQGIKTMIDGIGLRSYTPWLTLPGLWNTIGNGVEEQKYFKPLRNTLFKVKLITKLVDDKKNEIKRGDNNFSNSKTFVDLLLDGQTVRSTKNIVDHIITLLAAGSDTSALCMSFTLFMLANNPKHQRLVRDELDNIFGDRKDTYTTFEELGEMKHLEMCIKETLRLYPPAPLIVRNIVEDIKLENKKVIPKGCSAVIMLYDYHRDPIIFPDPEKFIPERFTPEEIAKRSPYDYLPFSVGLRNCIGSKYAMTEMKVFLAYVLRKYEVSTNITQEQVKVKYSIALIPRKPIQLNLKLRQL